MGAGYYSYDTAQARRSVKYAQASMEEIFTQKTMDPKMNPKGAIRECCETEEHPDTLPIIIGLDVTGSMGHVPAHLIKNDFPEVMKKILEEGVPCPQLCFVAYGDHLCDDFPLQIGQFEASDELMEKWLTSIYLEGGGGGNGGESTTLVYYFAARHTKCDAINKRGKKGLLITIGDEPNHRMLDKATVNKWFGGAEGDFKASSLLEEAKKKWDVYHVNINDYASQRYQSFLNWCNLLDDNVAQSETTEEDEICEVLSSIIIGDYKRKNPDGAQPEVEPTVASNSENVAVVKHDL